MMKQCFSLAVVIVILIFVPSDIASSEENASANYAGPKENLHIYLLIGQSNMAGRAEVPSEDAGVIDRCFLFNAKGEWEPAKNPLNRYSTVRKKLGMQKMNPGYMFSRTMLAAQPEISIGLVVNAKGGTKIQEWARDALLYKEAIKRTKEAKRSGVLKGVLWHQGEGNSKDPEYLAKLEQLIKNLREDLGAPDLPFVAGQIKNGEIINPQFAKLPETVPHTGFASSEGLTTFDKPHFDTKSMKILGKRYADAMLKVQKAATK